MSFSRAAFPAFCLMMAASAFAPGQISFAGTPFGWIATGALLTAGLLLTAAFGRNLWGAGALLLIAITLPASRGLPLEFGLPFLGIGAALAFGAPFPESRAPWRALALLGMGWLAWAFYGWYRFGIGPEESRWGFIKFFSPDWPGDSHWPAAAWPMGNANPLAGLLTMLLPLGVALTAAEARNRMARTPWACATAMAAALLYCTGSRAGIFAPVAAGLAVFVALPASRLSLRRKLSLAGLALAAFAFLLALSPAYRTKLSGGEGVSYSDAIRRDFLESGMKMFADHPLTGVGAGEVPARFGAYLSEHADHPGCAQLHCTPLQWAAEFGVAGLLLWLALAGLSLGALLRAARREKIIPLELGASVAATAYAAFSVFDYQLYIPITAFVWGACLGLAWRGTRMPAETRMATSRILPVAAAALAALVVWKGVRGASPRWHAREATRLMTAGNPLPALDELQAAMIAAPESPVYPAVAASWIAALPAPDATAAEKNRTMADSLYAKARENAPDFPYLAALQGWLWVDADPARAVTHFKASLARAPKLPQAWHGLARAYGRMGRPQDAVTCLALRGMIMPEDLFSPDLRDGGFFSGAAPLVRARFRELVSEYGRTCPEDSRGFAVLTQVQTKADAWAAAGERVDKFLEQNPDASAAPLRRFLGTVSFRPDANGAYPLRSRCIMSSLLHHVAEIEAKDGHAMLLLDQGQGKSPTFTGFRTLRSGERFAGFGGHFGEPSLMLAPAYTAETDLLALAYVLEFNPPRPHLRADWFTRRLAKLP